MVVIKVEVRTEWKGRTEQIGSMSLGRKKGRYMAEGKMSFKDTAV